MRKEMLLATMLAAMLLPAAQAAEQKLTASDGAANDFFGGSVAISGDTIVVGSPFDQVGANNRGSAHVFARSGGVWAQQQKLTASDGADFGQFGFGNTWVAIGGDTIIVGSPFEDIGANANQGSAYVFVQSGGVWTQQQKLTAGDGAGGDGFGFSVAMSGDALVVGALGDDTSRGAAYFFVRSGGVWTEQQKLTATDGVALDGFGGAVAISGDTIVAGATSDDGGRGSSYVFVRSGGLWTEQQRLTASDRSAGDVFGSSVAVGGDTIVVSSPFDDVGASVNQGSAYVFVRNGIVWAQQQKLTASDGAAEEQFGRVAIRGETIAVGAPGDHIGANNFQGSVYVFMRSNGVWAEQQKVTATDGTASDFFGFSVAIGQHSVVAGAPGDEGRRGSAYVYVRDPNEQLGDLEDLIEGLGLPAGIANSLLAKVEAALRALARGNTNAACNQLQALINEADAMSGNELTPDEANQIIEAAQDIRAALGCT